jgi:Right handed beta helix region
MSFTLRGRVETRLAAALLPLLAACALALWVDAWWPVELALLMIGLGVALDVAVYHRALDYQAGWLALPLACAELGVLMAVVLAAGVDAPLGAALGFFAGSWVLAQLLTHAGFPVLRLSYAEDGGELGRAGMLAVGGVALVVASAGGVAWATQPPTVRLGPGVHAGPLVLDREQTLVGEPGAVVQGGILVTADGVTVRDLTVIGGEHGIEVDGAERVRLERVRVSGVGLDGINVRRAQVTIEDCIVQVPADQYTQGIDISFGFDRAPSVVDGCIVHGGREGIVSHFAHVLFQDNTVTGTALRGITVTEMSMGKVARNEISGALGVGIYCGDYSHCEIERNRIANTRRDDASGDRTRNGFAIVSHLGAKAHVGENALSENAASMAAFRGASILPLEDG